MIFISGEDSILLGIIETTLKNKNIPYKYVPLSSLAARYKINSPDLIILATGSEHNGHYIEQIRKMSSEVRIVVITELSAGRKKKLIEKGATEVISSKNTKALVEAIQRILEKELKI